MLSSSSELTKTLLTRSELKSFKDPIPNRSHTFACLIVKERLVRGASLWCVALLPRRGVRILESSLWESNPFSHFF